MPIEIGADIDARSFIAGTDDMAEALENVEDAVKEVQKDGDKSLEKLEKSFAEVAKASRTAADDVAKSQKKGFKEAESGAEEFKDEANSTAKESAASFDGSAESIIDSFQEIAANAFQGFGPAGAVAGLALAAGIGIGTAAFQESEEAAQAAKERIEQLGLAMIESGETGEKPLELIVEELKAIVSNSEEAVKKFQDIEKASKFVGTSAEQLALAYAGQEKALESQLDVIGDLIEEQQKEVDAAAENGSRFGAVSQAKLDTLKAQQTELQNVQEETEAAAKIEQAWLESGGAEFLAKQEAISGINAAYDEAVFSVSDFINAETGILDVEAYLAAIDARKTALDDYQTALAKSDLSTDQKSALNEMGVEAAAAWMAGYQSATPEQQKRLKAALTEAAKENSGEAKKQIEKAFEKPIDAKVKVSTNVADVIADVTNAFKNKTMTLTVKGVDRFGKPVF